MYTHLSLENTRKRLETRLPKVFVVRKFVRKRVVF